LFARADFPDTRPGLRAQRGLHRIADHERAGEHERGERGAEDDAEVRAPVVADAVEQQAARGHCRRVKLLKQEGRTP
jgi:hypothetical protein